MDRRAHAVMLVVVLIAALPLISLIPTVSAASFHTVDTWSVTVETPHWRQVDAWTGTAHIPDFQMVDTWTVGIDIIAWRQVDAWSVTIDSINFTVVDSWIVSVIGTSLQQVDEWNCTIGIKIHHAVDNWAASVRSGFDHIVDTWLIALTGSWRSMDGANDAELPAIVYQVFGAGGLLMMVLGCAGTAWMWRRYDVFVVLAFAAFMIIPGLALAVAFIGF